ncbi:MAG: HlyD family efflux transporter periplasmic adaptor subunit [Candidatus Ozemobacteraceae bacterium]
MPRDFVPLCAPENSLSLPFWRSTSNSIQLTEIEPENKRVKAGDIIARFSFMQEDARDVLEQRLAKVKAQAEERLIKLKKTISEYEAALAVRKILTETAKLDLIQGSNLSKIRKATLEFAAQQQAFEHKSQEHKLKAARENFSSVEEVCKNQLAIWTRYFEMYEHAKKRYTVVSPEDGYLFYPHIERKKRKVQKGDDLPSGTQFLSVVKTDRSQLVFFLPEKELHRIKPSDEVTIYVDGREVPAQVTEIGFFPQRIGDVKDDYKLPDAWEKCFVVKADVLKPLAVGSNSNVRVGKKK